MTLARKIHCFFDTPPTANSVMFSALLIIIVLRYGYPHALTAIIAVCCAASVGCCLVVDMQGMNRTVPEERER